MPKKKGMCINFGGCSKAKAKEIQEAEVTQFVCEECGKPLRESKVSKDPKRPPIKLIVAIVAVVILAVGAFLLIPKGDSENAQNPESVEQAKEVNATPEENKDETVKPKAAKGGILDYATFKGETYEGKPDGKGILTFTKAYTIDLKNGSSLKVDAGDKVYDAYFEEGRLVRGELHRKNGERQVFHIGK